MQVAILTKELSKAAEMIWSLLVMFFCTF
uniref:Uncharacterized protein n=1 Tax=Medicago truncatula TaxID=3880 RepID=I3SUY2_MEDTR|nr:unknown [Medicago truncatula]